MHDRDHANEPEWTTVFGSATGIFITGGNQLRLSTRLGGTPVEQEIKRAWRGGATVAGTSAGASILSSHMVAFGASGPTPASAWRRWSVALAWSIRRSSTSISASAIVPGACCHWSPAVPGLLGVGVDEDTAAVFGSEGTIDVVGRHSVTIIDGSRMYTDYPEVKGFGEITVSGAVIHSLTAGRRFDSRNRRMMQL